MKLQQNSLLFYEARKYIKRNKLKRNKNETGKIIIVRRWRSTSNTTLYLIFCGIASLWYDFLFCSINFMGIWVKSKKLFTWTWILSSSLSDKVWNRLEYCYGTQQKIYIHDHRFWDFYKSLQFAVVLVSNYTHRKSLPYLHIWKFRPYNGTT